MVRVPIGKTVEIDLWNTNKGNGMVKYHTNTMDLIRAESRFELKKGDKALVVESYDSFVQVVPLDEYTELFKRNSVRSFDYKKLGLKIHQILKLRQEETGGLLPFEELFNIFSSSTIGDVLSRKQLMKAAKRKDIPLEVFEEEDVEYVGLLIKDCTEDIARVLKMTKERAFLTIDIVQKYTEWSDMRIKRILEYLVLEGRCRKEDSYREGERYYFHNIEID